MNQQHQGGPAAQRQARWGRLSPLVIVFCLVTGFGGGLLVSAGDDLSQPAGANSSLIDHPDADVLLDTWDLIQNHYVDQSAAEERELIYGASTGMVEALGDTGHSSFLSPEETEAFRAAMHGELIGIGVHLEYVGRRPVVVAAIEGSPAAEAGIVAGDVIAAVDDTITDGMSDLELSKRIRGEVGTDLTLLIERPSDGAELTVTLTRRLIRIEPVSWARLPGDLLLIRIREFSVGSSDALASALEDGRAAEANGIVLDLRNNPGGLVHELVAAASQFMPEGTTIYLEEDQSGNQRPVPTNPSESPALTVPMAVLINRGSASSAEILAATLMENGRATVLGERTYGTGTVLTPFELEDGSTVLLGTALWLTPDGNVIWKQGVDPAIQITLEPGLAPINIDNAERLSQQAIDASDDAQLRGAIDALVNGDTPAPGAPPHRVADQVGRSHPHAHSKAFGYTPSRV